MPSSNRTCCGVQPRRHRVPVQERGTYVQHGSMYPRELHDGGLSWHCEGPSRALQSSTRVENRHDFRVLNNCVCDSMRIRGAEVCDKAAHQAREE